MKESMVEIDGFTHRFQLLGADGKVLDEWDQHNLIPQAGLDFLIQAPFGDTPPITAFYVALLSGNYLPTSASVASDLPANEFVGYSEATRPLWERDYDGVGTLANATNRAQFTFTADRLIYGVVLVSSSAKGSGGGLLLSVVRFASPKQVANGLTLNVVSGVTYVPTNIV